MLPKLCNIEVTFLSAFAVQRLVLLRWLLSGAANFRLGSALVAALAASKGARVTFDLPRWRRKTLSDQHTGK